MNTLLSLARKRFASPDFSTSDRLLFQAVQQGKPADLHGEDLPADRLQWLCTDTGAVREIKHTGIEIVNARIVENVDLAYVDVEFPIRFDRCIFSEAIDLSLARCAMLWFEGCQTKSINARGLTVDGWFIFRESSKAEGEIRLVSSRIGRGLDFSNSELSNTKGVALMGDWLHVGGPVHMRNMTSKGNSESGNVRLYGAQIEGEIDMSNASLSNQLGTAFDGDAMKLSGTLHMSDGFRAVGKVTLVGAHIAGNWICARGNFDNNSRLEDDVPDPTDYALVADSIYVRSNVFLRNGFHADGGVRLYSAEVGGDLECQRGYFRNPEGIALDLYGAKIGGELRFGPAEAGKFCIVHGEIAMVGARVEGAFIWKSVGIPQMTLNLESATVGTLVDNRLSWPEKGQLRIHNFKYETIAHESPLDAAARTDWLARSTPFSRQAYDQLATVLRKQGRGADAKTILHARERRHAGERLRWGDVWWYRMFGPVVGYGYRVRYALILATVLVLSMAVLFEIAHRHELMRETKDNVPAFQFITYSLDVFLPIIDFAQAESWAPDPAKGVVLMSFGPWQIQCGGVLLFMYWCEIAVGWVLSALLAGTVTTMVVRT